MTMDRIAGYALMPFRIVMCWIWNVGNAVNHLVASLLGFNKDWTLSSIMGRLQYEGYRAGSVGAWAIDIVAFAFTLRLQHCRIAYLKDRQDGPSTIWVEGWEWARR